MQLLTDTELKTVVVNAKLLKDANEQNIKGCTIDLTIGEIYIPGCKTTELGSISNPREESSLKQGATAVIKTHESFALDGQHAGVAFPASSVSLKGLLMTNPGHIDPNYDGHLHITVINMGRESYNLKKGDRLLRTMIFKLHRSTAASVKTAKLGDELLARLSPDFMDMEKRVDAAASKAIDTTDRRNLLRQAAMPLIIAIVTAALTVLTGYFSFKDKFDERIARIEASNKELNASVRFEQLDTKLKQVGELTAPAPLAKQVEDLRAEIASLKKNSRSK